MSGWKRLAIALYALWVVPWTLVGLWGWYAYDRYTTMWLDAFKRDSWVELTAISKGQGLASEWIGNAMFIGGGGFIVGTTPHLIGWWVWRGFRPIQPPHP